LYGWFRKCGEDNIIELTFFGRSFIYSANSGIECEECEEGRGVNESRELY